MKNKSNLTTYCESIIEMGWLAALVVVPLFFNPYSARIFEPDKVSLLSTIALTMLTAWLIKLIDSGLRKDEVPSISRLPEQKEQPREWKSYLKNLWATPLAIPSLMFLLAHVISSFFSIAPENSWWGEYGRTQGTYALLCISIIAFLAALHLREPQQLHRIRFAIILTSFSIAFYGIIQYLGRDPINFSGYDGRVTGSSGNAIYLAAYLTIAFLVTLERLYTACFKLYVNLKQGSNSSNNGTSLHLITISVYLVVAGVQTTTILLTQSRGPILGLIAGLGFALLVGFVTLWKKQGRWMLIALACICLFSFALFRFSSLTLPPALERVTSQLVNPDSLTARSRFLIWQSMEELYTQSAPIAYINQETDSFDFWRPLIGYGPDTLNLLFVTVYPPELLYIDDYTKVVDQAHSNTWQLLYSVGLLGYVAYLCLYCQIFYWILRWLSLLITRRDCILFYALLSSLSILLTVLAFIYTGRWSLIGLTIPGGLLMGMLLYIMTVIGRVCTSPKEQTLMLILMLAIAVSHLVETAFGIATFTTQLIFWLMIALLAALAQGKLVIAAVPVVVSKPPDKRLFSQSVVMLHGLIFLTFVFLYSANHQTSSNWFTILVNTLITSTNTDGTVMANSAVFWLLIATWLVGAILALVTPLNLSNIQIEPIQWRNRILSYSAVVWGGWLLYSFIQCNLLIFTETMSIYDIRMRQANFFTLYTWLLILWMLVAPWLWQGRFYWKTSQKMQRKGMRKSQGSVIALGLMLCLLSMLIIHNVNIKPIQADGLFRGGQSDQNRHFVDSVMLYQQAIKLNRIEANYSMALANLLFEKAKGVGRQNESTQPAETKTEITIPQLLAFTPAQIQAMSETTLLDSSETLVSAIIDQAPLDIDSRMMKASLLHHLAMLADNSQQKDALFADSLAILEQLLEVGPSLTKIWNAKGTILMAAGRLDEAEEAYLHSLSINSLNWMTYQSLIILYTNTQSYTKQIALAQRILDERLLDRSRIYLEISPNRNSQPRNAVRSFVQSSLMEAHYQLGNYEESIEAALQLNELQPHDLTPIRTLISIYRKQGHYKKAIDWASAGLELLDADNPNERLEFRQYLLEFYEFLEQPDEMASTSELLRRFFPDDPEIAELESIAIAIQLAADKVDALIQRYASDPADLMAIRELIAYYRDQHDYAEAIKWTQEGIKQLTNDQTIEMLEFQWMLVDLYTHSDQVSQGDFTDASTLLQSYLPPGQMPEDLIMIRTIMSLHKNRQHYLEAVYWIKQGIGRLGPDQRAEQIEFHQALADLYTTLDDQEGLIDAYETLHSYSPNDTNLLNILYQLYVQKSDVSRIEYVLQSLGRLEPENYVYSFLLAQLYQVTAEFDKARDFAEQALKIVPDANRQQVVDLLASLE